MERDRDYVLHSCRHSCVETLAAGRSWPENGPKSRKTRRITIIIRRRRAGTENKKKNKTKKKGTSMKKKKNKMMMNKKTVKNG